MTQYSHVSWDMDVYVSQYSQVRWDLNVYTTQYSREVGHEYLCVYVSIFTLEVEPECLNGSVFTRISGFLCYA